MFMDFKNYKFDYLSIHAHVALVALEAHKISLHKRGLIPGLSMGHRELYQESLHTRTKEGLQVDLGVGWGRNRGQLISSCCFNWPFLPVSEHMDFYGYSND